MSVNALPLGLDWNSIFLLQYKTIRETCLQSFAYKLTYRLSPCNIYLSKIQIKDDDTCSLCAGTDSISHFFLKCDIVKPFWEQLTKWCTEYLGVSLGGLTEAQLLFGILNRMRDGKVLNWLILFAKFFIQKRKLFFQGNIPLIVFLREVRARIYKERLAGIWQNRANKFRPWQRLLDALG